MNRRSERGRRADSQSPTEVEAAASAAVRDSVAQTEKAAGVLRRTPTEVHAAQKRWPKRLLGLARNGGPPHGEVETFKQEAKERLTGKRADQWTEMLMSTRRGALRSGVLGVGFGAKVSDGQVVARDCLRIYVLQKRLRRDVPRTHRIPRSINGVTTDVIELSRVEAQAVLCGVSVSHFRFTAGTLGCLVSKGGRVHILSNNHVLARNNAASIGDEIWQPGAAHGGRAPAIAHLSDFEPLHFRHGTNLMDAAMAEVAMPNDVLSEVLTIGKLNPDVMEASAGLLVEKVGCGSNHTHGYIEGTSEDVVVNYRGRGVAVFAKQISVRGVTGTFTAEGDSGALVVAAEANAPVGLHFAAGFSKDRTTSLSFCTPLGRVLSEFGVALIT